MKKRISATILLVITVLTFLVGCGKKVKCDFCGETKKGETRTVFGESVSMCNDCMRELSDF